jgi:hypothetical protein
MSNRTRLSVALLWIAALGLLAIAVLHGMGMASVGAALDRADLQPFVVGAFRAVWLGFSATALLLAVLFAMAAVRRDAVGRAALGLLALVPIASALLVYLFVGPFIGAHLMLAVGAAGIAGALLRD